VAAPGWRTSPSLEEVLFHHGYEFEFFQAVRLLARTFSNRREVGGTARPAEEFVRFSAIPADGRLSMVFPASAVHDIQKTIDSSYQPRMTVNFFGLSGTWGVLPFYYTDRMVARKTAKDETLAAFFDLFNHRLLALFYRAWEKHHPPILYELAAARGEQPDTFTQSLYDVIGMGTAGLRGRMGIEDETLLFYAGLIAQRPHSASALRGILRDYFSVAVEIAQCIGGWYRLEEADRCYLSEEMERNQLGEGAFIGDEVWDQQSRFRIRLGPVGLKRFVEFLPNSRATAKLVELTKYIVGLAIVFDVQVFLRASEVPYCRLDDEGFDAPRLGWMGWLKTEEFAADAGDAVSTWVS
jgi:type VI secretion system protein ImpH